MKKNIEDTYRQERSRLLGWMGGRIGAEEAEDALHDVIIRSLVNLDSMEGIRDLTAWLWRCAQNAVVDVWRKKGRRHDAEFTEIIDASIVDAGDRLAREEVLSALIRAIDRLPAEQKAVIVAQSLDGETFRSLSRRTGIPAETLAARKRYALARLRESMAGWQTVQ